MERGAFRGSVSRTGSEVGAHRRRLSYERVDFVSMPKLMKSSTAKFKFQLSNMERVDCITHECVSQNLDL